MLGVAETLVTEFVKARATDATDSSFPSKVPTTTEPTGDGVIDLGSGSRMPSNLILVPFGTGSDNTTFDMRVIGWRKVSTLWVPVPLCQLSCTLSAAVGVSGATITNTQRFADTITVALGNSGVDVTAISPANDTVAQAMIDAKGYGKIEVTFDLTGATAANTLWGSL